MYILILMLLHSVQCSLVNYLICRYGQSKGKTFGCHSGNNNDWRFSESEFQQCCWTCQGQANLKRGSPASNHVSPTIYWYVSMLKIVFHFVYLFISYWNSVTYTSKICILYYVQSVKIQMEHIATVAWEYAF